MRISRLLPLLSLLLLSFACAESASLVGTTGAASEGSTTDFDLTIVQTSAPPVMRGQTDVDVRFEITVANRTQEPYTIKRIGLQSMSSAGFEVPITSREFEQTIPAGTKKRFDYWARALVSDLGTARQPVTIRVTLDAVDASGSERKETFISRINGRVTATINAWNR